MSRWTDGWAARPQGVVWHEALLAPVVSVSDRGLANAPGYLDGDCPDEIMIVSIMISYARASAPG